jgi:hypothetical protein
MNVSPTTIEYRPSNKDTRIKNNNTESDNSKLRQTNLLEFGFQQIYRKYKSCCKCNRLIFFDSNVKNSKGRILPREKSTGLIHNCPGRTEEQ